MTISSQQQHFASRHVCTSPSVWFKAASTSFAMHANFTISGSKVDQFEPHTVSGLKQIQVDSMSMVGSVRLKCIFPTTLHKP